jgi:predicted RecA/RadA family phage recombinase
MAQNYKQSGKVFDYTIPAATTIASEDVVIMGGVAGVALGGGTTGDVIPVQVCGVFNLPKKTTSGNAFTVGSRVYYDPATGTVTTDATKTFIGYAYTAAVQATTTVDVMLADAPTAGGTAGVAPQVAPTMTSVGSVVDNTKASIDTEVAKLKADTAALRTALIAAGVLTA